MTWTFLVFSPVGGGLEVILSPWTALLTARPLTPEAIEEVAGRGKTERSMADLDTRAPLDELVSLELVLQTLSVTSLLLTVDVSSVTLTVLVSSVTLKSSSQLLIPILLAVSRSLTMPESLLLLAKDLGVLVFLKKDFLDLGEDDGCLTLSFLRRRGEEGMSFFVFLRVVMLDVSMFERTLAFFTGSGMTS